MLAILALASCLPAAPPQETRVDVVANRAYHTERGAEVIGLGVCSITPDNVVCWDMDGKKDAGLTDKTRSQIQPSHARLYFHYGRKNRHLVVWRDDSSYTSVTTTAGNSYSFSDSSSLGSTDWLFFAAGPEERTASILLNFYRLPGEKPVTIPFKKGAKGVYGRIEIEIGGWSDLSKAVSGQAARTAPHLMHQISSEKGGKFWLVYLGMPRQASVTVTPLGRNGKRIPYVDRKGKPVSELKYLEGTQGGLRPVRQDAEPEYHTPVFDRANIYHQLSSAEAYYTNIDPREIGALSFYQYKQMVVRIDGFPLDPAE